MNRDGFISRWSRLKAATAAETGRPPQAPRAASDPLPDPATLDFESDFTLFLGIGVDASARYQALSKLFHSPQFNVMDGLDVYIDDYTKPDPVSEELLKDLGHVRELLADDAAPAAESTAPAAPAAAAEQSHE
ncbi:MAG TPA: DUF3306 domain-containing protein [Rhodocyclaceae bacterium]